MGLTSSVLIPIGTWLATKIADKGFDTLSNKLTKQDTTDRFYKIVNKTSDELQNKYPFALGGSIEYFFKHEEIFSELTKLLFFNSKLNLQIIEDKFDTTSLPPNFILEFIETLRKNLYEDSEFSKILSNKELYISTIGLSNNISSLVNSSNLTLDEIKEIRKLLEDKFDKKFNFYKFKENYYKNAHNNLSQVNFLGLGIDMSIKKGKRKKITDIFIKPSFNLNREYYEKNKVKYKNNLINRHGILSFNYLFSYEQHLVILGNPGSGKSFLVKYIICSLINNDSEYEQVDIFNFIPFRIELRKYITYKKTEGGNIINYLSYILGVEYSIYNIPQSTLQDLIDNNKTILFFDGLDEIFNISDRIEVKNDIENFVLNNNNTRTITTSRIIGYDESSLNPEKFIELRINNFSDADINDYVTKWYNIEEDDITVREKEINYFIDKCSNIDNELKSNPLLLSLIVILYRNNLKLPESKLEIYQSCTSTLVDKWDLSKSLLFELDDDVYKRKEAIFAALAYWQYIELSNKKEAITYDRAKNTVADILHNKLKLVDEYVAEIESEKFMDYAIKRSIYFDNNFTHKTFLEYYTAFWIFTNIEKKHNKTKRNEIITIYIDNSFWHIVLELLFNLIDKDQPDNEIMDEMILAQDNTSKNTLSFLLNVLPSLKNVSNSCIIKIIESGIKYLLSKKTQADNTIFIELSRYTTKDKYSQYLETAFNNFNLQVLNKYKLQKLITLYYELHHNVNNFNNKSISFCNTPILKDISDKDYQLSFYNLILFKNKHIYDNPFEILTYYTKKFGKSKCLSEVDMKFLNVMYVSLARICINHAFTKDNLTHLPNELSKIESLGYNDHEIYNLLNNIMVNNSIILEVIRRIFVLLNTPTTNKIESYLLFALNSLINNPNNKDQKNKITDIISLIYNNELKHTITLITESNSKVGQTIILNKYKIDNINLILNIYNLIIH